MRKTSRNSQTAEREIYQKSSEPSRKQFSDGQKFDLVVWYRDSMFREISGFQLSFRETPFATDDEYFLTLRPGRAASSGVEIGRTHREGQLHPTSKVIHPTTEKLPDAFHRQIGAFLEGLPADVLQFVRNAIRAVLEFKK